MDSTTPETQDQDTRLETLKKQALEVLVSLVDQIQDSPERRFEILITASRSKGDAVLLEKALQAAQQIEDASDRARAVLDVLNEINYQLSN